MSSLTRALGPMVIRDSSAGSQHLRRISGWFCATTPLISPCESCPASAPAPLPDPAEGPATSWAPKPDVSMFAPDKAPLAESAGLLDGASPDCFAAAAGP